jgi:hypothetical protein
MIDFNAFITKNEARKADIHLPDSESDGNRNPVTRGGKMRFMVSREKREPALAGTGDKLA